MAMDIEQATELGLDRNEGNAYAKSQPGQICEFVTAYLVYVHSTLLASGFVQRNVRLV
jgi:hypothetical protein